MTLNLDEPRISNLGKASPEMLAAFTAGCESYYPVVRGVELEQESGVTSISCDNINKLTKLYGPVVRFEAGKDMTVLCHFADDHIYLATGFGWSYGGGGPNGFARLAAEMGVGTFEANLKYLCNLPREYEGKLFTGD